MRSYGKKPSKQADRTAARWFVEVVDQRADAGAEKRFSAWLDSDSQHEDELARCEASIHMTRQLRADGDLRWAFADAADLAHARTGRPARPLRPAWFRNPAIAWGVAGMSIALAVLAMSRGSLSPSGPVDRAGEGSSATLSLALASTEPVVELPGHIIVDAHSVAILPFTTTAIVAASRTPPSSAELLARAMHGDLVDELSTIPGLYVVGRESVQPYDGADIAPAEIAANLGVRGVVEGTVSPANGLVRIVLRLTDAATGELLFQGVYERSMEQLNSVDAEMANTIALALAQAGRPPSPIQTGEIT